MKNLRADIAELFAELAGVVAVDLDMVQVAFREAEAARLREYRRLNPAANREYTKRWRARLGPDGLREYHRARRWPGAITNAELAALADAASTGSPIDNGLALRAFVELQSRRKKRGER